MKERFLTTPLRFAVLGVTLVLFVVVLFGSFKGKRNTANQIEDWLPVGFRETSDFHWYLSHFHEGGILMVSWDGCAIDSPALDRIRDDLTSSEPEKDAIDRARKYLDSLEEDSPALERIRADLDSNEEPRIVVQELRKYLKAIQKKSYAIDDVAGIIFSDASDDEALRKIRDYVDALKDSAPEIAPIQDYLASQEDASTILARVQAYVSSIGAPSPTFERISDDLTLSASGEPLFSVITTTTDVLQTFRDGPSYVGDEDAFQRMRGWIISKDYRQGCFLAYYSEKGYANPHAAIASLKKATSFRAKIAESDVRIAGATADSVAIDEASARSQKTFLPLFLLASILILFALLRSWLAVGVVFSIAIFNEELTGALMWFTNTQMDSISVLSSSLLFVLTISGSLHLLNYYRDNVSRTGRRGAVTGALRHALIPCSFACFTTVLGLFSLTVSRIAPIRKFGIFSTITLVLGTIAFLIYISAFLEQFPIMKWRYQRADYKDEEEKVVWDNTKKRNSVTRRFESGLTLSRNSRSKEGTAPLFSEYLPKFTLRFPKTIIAVNLIALVFLAVHIPNLKTVVTFHGMFPKDARVIQDYDYLETRFGGLTPIEAVLSIPKAENKDDAPLRQLSLLSDVQNATMEIEEIESVVSALNFAPELPDLNARSFRAVGARSAFNKAIVSRLDMFHDWCLYDAQETPQDVEQGAPEAWRWRMSFRVRASEQLDYAVLLPQMREKIERTIAEREGATGLSGSTVLLTGGVPLAFKAQTQLLSDLTNSYLSAFLLILITLIFLLRGSVAGLLAMIPNVFPSVVVFGFMALIGKPVDIGSMMTASVALGISVDGTIHFLNWYRQAMREGRSDYEAARFAYRQCAAAMTQTTIICGGGMLIFAWSQFLPVARFAVMMAVLLTFSLYADLVLFPPMLIGRLGRFSYPPRLRGKYSAFQNLENVLLPRLKDAVKTQFQGKTAKKSDVEESKKGGANRSVEVKKTAIKRTDTKKTTLKESNQKSNKRR